MFLQQFLGQRRSITIVHLMMLISDANNLLSLFLFSREFPAVCVVSHWMLLFALAFQQPMHILQAIDLKKGGESV
jgi:hypothetical protein